MQDTSTPHGVRTRRQTAVRLRVLLVEDDPADAALMREHFRRPYAHEARASITEVGRLATARARLAGESFDAILFDLSLPDATGLDGLRTVTTEFPAVPVVVMMDSADDDMAIEAVKLGAEDYIAKAVDGAREVRRAVRYAVERHRLQRRLADLVDREHELRTVAEGAVRARDEMLGIVSHDLRNPLSAISLAASALPLENGDGVARLAEIVGRSAELAQHIIRDLLDVTAIEAGRLRIVPEPMTSQAIAETLLTLFTATAESRGIHFGVELQGAPRWVTLDVDRTVQAVGNFIANALKFTPRGGNVAVSIASGPRGELTFGVRDDGPGIAPDDLPHVFDRFWQARARRGTAGLGLAIAQGIATAHGGWVAVESTPGKGSTFTLGIPLSVDEPR